MNPRTRLGAHGSTLLLALLAGAGCGSSEGTPGSGGAGGASAAQGGQADLVGGGGTGGKGGGVSAAGSPSRGGGAGTAGGGPSTLGGSSPGSGGAPAPAGAGAGPLAGNSGASGAANALPWLDVEGNKIRSERGNTVVLRGVALMDLGATEEWYGGVKAMIDRLTDEDDTQGDSPGWYPKVLRFAVYPEDGEVESPLTYQKGSDTFYETLLRPIIDYCREKGLYAIIDWHYIEDTTAHVDSTSDFWAYIAPKFANDSHVLFELFNEPINDGDWDVVRGHMQTWYDIVRASAPRNLVLVGTPNWSSHIGPSATDPVEGTNIAYVAHMYPYHFGVRELREELSAAAAVHPVFVTEWGFDADAGADILQGSITSYGNPFKQFLEENGASWTAWVASYDWAPPIFNEDFSLRVGEGRMGGFVKDWLYERRDADRP